LPRWQHQSHKLWMIFCRWGQTCWNDGLQGVLEYPERNMSDCHIYHHESHMDSLLFADGVVTDHLK
jgi:hypothetical protein